MLVAPTVTSGTVIAVDAAAFASALGVPSFRASQNATLHDDTVPLPLSSGTQGSGGLAVPMRSGFQYRHHVAENDHSVRLDAAPHRRRCIHNGRYMVKPYEQMLEQCGFALAAGPLRAMFELEGVTDQRLQPELAHDVVERTMCALQTLTRPRNTVH